MIYAWIFGMCLAALLIVAGIVWLSIRDYDRGLQGFTAGDWDCLELTEEDDGR